MKNFIEFMMVCMIVTVFLIIGAFLVTRLTARRDNAEMGPWSQSFKSVVRIKKDCSEKVSSLIREKVSDGVLTRGECDEIINLHAQECNQKDITELSK